MKVLITGFTSSMTTGRSAVGFETLTSGMVRYFDGHPDHEVRRQPMYVETNKADLEWADVMLVGIGPFNALGSRYIYGALDAIAHAHENDCALAFYVSDWQTHLIKSSIKSMLKVPDRFVKELMKHRTDFYWAREPENLATMVNVLQAFYDKPWPITLVPTHPWRPTTLTLTKLDANIPARELVHIDPTCYTTAAYPDVPFISSEDRAREWVLAALGDYSMWLANKQLEWPVRYFGGKTFSGPKTDDIGLGARNKRVKETEVNENYHQVWGGLSPAYALSGSGWWRTRYHFITKAGAILLGEPHEVGMIGPSFNIPDPHVIEGYTTDQLTQLAAAQRAEFWFQSEDDFDVRMEYTLKRAREEMP